MHNLLLFLIFIVLRVVHAEKCDTHPLCQLDLPHLETDLPSTTTHETTAYNDDLLSQEKIFALKNPLEEFEQPLEIKERNSKLEENHDILDQIEDTPVHSAFRGVNIFDPGDVVHMFSSHENKESPPNLLKLPIESSAEILGTTETPYEEPSKFRDESIFSDPEKASDMEFSHSEMDTYDYENSFKTDETPTPFKVDSALILSDLDMFERKRKEEPVERSPTPTMMSTLVFPPTPRGDQYRVLNLGLDDGYFVFSFMGPLLSFIQPAVYPLELVRDAIKGRVDTQELITESLSMDPGTIGALTMAAMFGIGTPLVLIGVCCVAASRSCKDDGKLEDPSDCSDGGSSRGGCGNCRRRGLVFAMFLILILVGFGVTGILLANEQVKTGASRAPEVTDTLLNDASSFVKNSHQQLRFLVTSAIDQATEATASDLDNIESLLGRPVQREIATRTGIDVALDLLTDISMAAQAMAERCESLQESAGSTRHLARTTNERLAELRAQLDSFRRNCPGRDRPLCDTLDTAGLDVTVRLDKLLNDGKLAQIRRLRNDSLASLAQKARTEFQFIPHQMEASTRDARIGIRREIETQRTTLHESLIPIDNLAQRLQQRLQGIRGKTADFLRPLPEIEQWRWIVGLSSGVLVLVIWLVLLLAISCGCCGAEKQAGCAVITAFILLGLLSTGLWAVAMAGMILGSRGEMFACRPLNDEPEFHALSALLDTSLHSSASTTGFLANLAYGNQTLDVPLKTVLADCRDNNPTYPTFRLQRLFDVERAIDHRTWGTYHSELTRLRVDLHHLQVLSPELARRLGALLDATTVDLAKLRAEMSGHVTARDLKSLASQLESVANQIRDQNTASRLGALVTRTRRLLNNNVLPLEKHKDELVYQMTALEVQLLPLNKQVNQSLSHLKTIQYFISNQGSAIAQEKSRQFAGRLLSYMDQFQSHIADSLRGSVAPTCRPVWNFFHAARQLTCSHVIDPMNGFWLSMSWSLLLLLMAVPTGLALIDHYSRMRQSSLLARATNSTDSPPTSDAWATPNNNGDSSGNW